MTLGNVLLGGVILWLVGTVWLSRRGGADFTNELLWFLGGVLLLTLGSLIFLVIEDRSAFFVLLGMLTLFGVLVGRENRQAERIEAAFLSSNPVFLSAACGLAITPNGLERELFIERIEEGVRIGIRYEERDHDNTSCWGRTTWSELFASEEEASKELVRRLYQDYMGGIPEGYKLEYLNWRKELEIARGKLERRDGPKLRMQDIR